MDKLTLIKNIDSLVTLEPLHLQKHARAVQEKHLGVIRNAWVLLNKSTVLEIGSGNPSPHTKAQEIIDAMGGLILPALCDAHTHLLFAGSRADEFALKLEGKTYQEIAANGGGIQSTVNATRQASDEELRHLFLNRLDRLYAQGIATVEVKSGYGLSVKEELRHLRIIKSAFNERPDQKIAVTALPLHAIPKEAKSANAYVEEIIKDFLPVVAREQLAVAVDAFVEAGYFDVSNTRPYLDAAKKHGLHIRLHADEFSDADAASLAAEVGAQCADHLQHASEKGLKAMAERGVIAMLLPGTSLCSKIPFTDAGRIRRAGCEIGVASDFNPGSCTLDQLHLLASIGATQCGLTAAEAIAAVTFVATKSLGLARERSRIAAGQPRPPLALYNIHSVAEWVADFGKTLPTLIPSH